MATRIVWLVRSGDCGHWYGVGGKDLETGRRRAKKVKLSEVMDRGISIAQALRELQADIRRELLNT